MAFVKKESKSHREQFAFGVGLHFVEEGCYVLAGENIDVLGEVSPDGSIRRLNSDNDDTPIL